MYCRPVRYARLHEQFVSAEDRANPLYAGYSLCVDLEFIRSRCKRVGNADED